MPMGPWGSEVVRPMATWGGMKSYTCAGCLQAIVPGEEETFLVDIDGVATMVQAHAQHVEQARWHMTGT